MTCDYNNGRARRDANKTRDDLLRTYDEITDDDAESPKTHWGVSLGIMCVLAFACTFAACIVALAVWSKVAGGTELKPRLTLTQIVPTRDYLSMSGGAFLVGRPNFTGCAPWELHEVRADHLNGPGDRTLSHWRADDRCIPERHIGDADYRNNPLALDEKAHPQGMARFHLCPAADESQSQDAINGTHVTSNCVPADQEFNANSWEKCEQRGRDLVLLAKKMNVKARVFECNVPLFLMEPPQDFSTHAWVATFNAVGRNCVWVPNFLAKSLLVFWGDRVWLETYLFENSHKVAHDEIGKHLVALDRVEFFSNLDIWPGLDLEDEEASDSAPPTLEELGGDGQ